MRDCAQFIALRASQMRDAALLEVEGGVDRGGEEGFLRGEEITDPIAERIDGSGQQPPAGPGTPGPAAGWSTIPVTTLRSTAPKWTTYQTPRQEISEAMPNERS